jgi:branched-chain amino acid transport system substrate-binding protein
MAVVNLRRIGTIAASGLAIALLATSCSNAKSTSTGGGGAPGVTSNSITVGAVAAITGTFSEGFGDIVYGQEAYFRMINNEGGVDGRKIDLKYVLNDQGSGTTDADDIRDLVTQDKVFAITAVGSAGYDSSSYLASTGTPTFGYNVTGNWQTYPNLFAMNGPTQDYQTEPMQLAWTAKELGVKSAAIVAYPFESASADACAAVEKGLAKFGVHVGFYDPNLSYEENPSADVQKMAAAHVDMLYGCTDGPENLKFVQTMNLFGLKNVYTFWLNGYNRTLITPQDTIVGPDVPYMTNSIFSLEHVPFEVSKYYPAAYPGMDQYVSVMKKYERQYTYDDLAYWGWACGEAFVAGLKSVAASGKPLTQKNLVDAVNALKHYTAGGTLAPINPTVGASHTSSIEPWCSGYVIVMPGGTLKPMFVQHGNQTLVCFTSVDSDTPASPLPASVPPNT